jgi:hypothetical protein
MTQRGYAIGIPLSHALYSYHGLLTRQIMGIVTANWKRPMSQLHRMNCVQAYSGNPTWVNTMALQGSHLCGTSCGNSLYQSVVGVDYNQFPNRPGDYTDGLCIAPYFSGSQAANNYSLNTYSGISKLIGEAAAYATGTATNVSAALAWLDGDYRNGTGGNSEQKTLSYIANNVYAGWVSSLVRWPNIALYMYEGGLEPVAPGVLWLSSQGDTNAAIDNDNIKKLIVGYRSSAYAAQIVQDYCTQFLNAGPMVKGCAWLGIEGGTTWSLLPGNVAPLPLNSSNTYQLFYGVCTFNNGGECHAKLEPANDDVFSKQAR